VLALVDRTTGRARAMVVDSLKAKDLTPILRQNIAKEARVMTDEAGQYVHLRREFAEHGIVHHGAGEYGRGDIHTNTIEGYFSIFKRGTKGVYQHCAKKHLHRYVAEFNFRYNERAMTDLSPEAHPFRAGIVGKRLTYGGLRRSKTKD
jgi:transposase-like protein